MKLRSRALFATSALLYLGPLLAGLGGYGIETLPVFGIAFMIWLAIVRPGDWPANARAWRNPRSVAWPMLIFGIQLVLIGFLVVVGTGMQGLAGGVVPLNLASAYALPFAGVFAAWLLRTRRSHKLVRIRAEALEFGAGILDIAAPDRPGVLADEDFIAAAGTLLAEMGERGAGKAEVDPILQRIENSGAASQVLDSLSETEGAAFARAQVRLALRPSVAQQILGEGRILEAINRALGRRDPALAEETAVAARALMALLPGLVRELPEAGRLRAAAERFAEAPAAAEKLRLLADEAEAARAA